MTAPQPKRPAPPDGYANWLDYVLDPYTWSMPGVGPHARVMARQEFAELRQALSDTQGLLAQAQENALAIDAQRAEAAREMVEAEDLMHEVIAASYKLKALLVRCVNDGTDGGADDDVSLEFLSHVPAECAAVKKQRDALRAQVAEMRAELNESDSDHDVTLREYDKTLTQLEQLTAKYEKLRAEALPGAESKEEAKQ